MERGARAAAGDAGGDAYQGRCTAVLPPATIRELSRVSAAATTGHLLLEFALIAAAVVLCEAYWHPLLYVLVVMFIGARAHAIGIIGLHDGAHYRLFRNKRLNDFVAAWLLCAPLLRSLHAYRRFHFAHHRHAFTERDPDIAFDFMPRLPMTRRRLARMLTLHLSGVAALQYLWVTLRETPPAMRAAALALALAGAALLAAGFAPARLLALYWVVPLLTWGFTITQLRTLGEHYRVAPEHPLHRDHALFQTRELIPSPFDLLFVASKGITYHLAHHIHPSVPFHRVRRLHDLLMQQPAFASQVHITRGYHNLLRELTRGADR